MTPIYHITHIANLPAILQEDGLLCDAEAERRGLCAQSIAYDSIKERRKRRRVETLQGQPVAAAGVVADYVPFYFSNRSPMPKPWQPSCRDGVSPTATRWKLSRNFIHRSLICGMWILRL